MIKGIDASEIARLAGVSRATVSRVINNYAFVKSATRERVLNVIEEHGYSPNFSAQILAGKRANTIGLFLLLPDFPGYKSRLEDTHTNFMTERIINTAALAGNYVLVYQVRDLDCREERKKIRDMFCQSRIDAGVFVGFPNSCDLIEELVGHGFVIGVFNQHLPGKSEPNRILVRLDYSGFNELVDYAAGLGHRDIMFLSGDMVRQSGVDIFQVFRQGMARNGLEVREDIVLPAGEFTKTHAAAAFSAFMDSRRPMPSCIICANDILAFGVLEVLRLQGLRVPADVSIIGADDILVSQYFDPPLTTMAYDFDEMMKTLTAKVMEYVKHPFSEQFIATYSGKIVIRDSCARNG